MPYCGESAAACPVISAEGQGQREAKEGICLQADNGEGNDAEPGGDDIG